MLTRKPDAMNTTAKTWERPRGLSEVNGEADRRIPTVGCSSVTVLGSRKEQTWVDLEDMNEKCQDQKITYL